MAKPEKVQAVQDLRDRIARATIAVSTDYRGLRVQEMTRLRRRLRAAGLEVKVVKNTLVRLAAAAAGQPALMEVVEGPTALAFGYGDVIEAARAVIEYAQSAPPTFAVRGAYLDGAAVSAQDLRDLVQLPPRPVLVAQLMGQLEAPLAHLAALLEGPLHELSTLLQSAVGELPALLEARARQMETM